MRNVPSWKTLAIGGVVLGGIGALILAGRSSTKPKSAPKRVALIGDSYAVGLGPELAKLIQTFRFEGHKGTSASQWAHHATACGECGDWLTLFKPDLVLISLGTNDDPILQTNFDTIVRGLHGIGARVAWISPPNPRAGVTNAFGSTGVQIIPAIPVPMANSLHPNTTGYRMWAQEIAQKVLT